MAEKHVDKPSPALDAPRLFAEARRKALQSQPKVTLEQARAQAATADRWRKHPGGEENAEQSPEERLPEEADPK